MPPSSRKQLQRWLDPTGKLVVRRRMQRETVIAFAAKRPDCVVAMEACCGAHHMNRALAAQTRGSADVARICAVLGEGAEAAPHFVVGLV